MIKTIIKVSLIAGSMLAIVSMIPDLFTPVAIIIDDLFDLNLVSLMNNFYSVIPSELMSVFVGFFSVLAIGIIYSWVSGGKDE